MLGSTDPVRRRGAERRLRSFVISLTWFLTAVPAAAETLSEALARTYQANPQLNAERARQRATDESVAQVLVGYRPQIMASLSAGLAQVRDLLPDNTIANATMRPWTIGVTVTQVLFNGLKTANSVRAAEFQVKSGREALRNVGQGVLLDSVTAYMNLLTNKALVEAQRANVSFLQETLAVTRRRLSAGDVTPTDAAQAEARLSRGKSDLNAAEVAYAVSKETYAQVTGEAPGVLVPAATVDRLSPPTRDDSISIARSQKPLLLAAGYDVDMATATIGVAQSSLLPQVSVQGSASVDTDMTLTVKRTHQASIVGQASVPIYDGGMAAAQAKELAAQSRMVLKRVRNRVRTAVASAWVTNEGTKVALRAAESEVLAARIALEGVRREAQAGQRTTVELLNAQQDLVNARTRQIVAQRDRVIASYTSLNVVGRLDVRTLNLNRPDYLPEVHYIKSAMLGTGSGRHLLDKFQTEEIFPAQRREM